MGDTSCAVGEKLAALDQEIRELKAQVSTDPLTGLSNVRHLKLMLEREMERTQRNHQPVTLLIIDVDHFKSINDTHGHIVGDKALRHLSAIIQSVVRKIDIPCRYGGEEFAIVLPSTPILVGIQVAERVRSMVEDSPLITEEDKHIAFSVSVGVATYTRTEKPDIEHFIAAADEQLYKAKNGGRNQVCYPSDSTTSRAEVTQSEKDALFNVLNNDD